MALVQGLEPRTPESESDVLPLHYTSICGASSQDRTDHLILTMDTLYLLSYGSINGVVDRIRTCMSHKGLLAFQASAPPAERLRHFGVRSRTRTETPLINGYWRFSRPLPYQLGLNGRIGVESEARTHTSL